MKYYYKLYISDDLLQKQEQIIQCLEEGKWQLSKYLIVLAGNEKNNLEIFDSVLLLQNAIPKDNLFVVGIAGGKDRAFELVEKITAEVYDNTRSTDIRNYILQKQSEYEKGNV